ncbi:HMG domain-containing protein 4a isoform 1-T2 [Clarias gariepinus]|uniref:HMG domain-containing protein 4a isoform X1 n=1 Tax=Clarias gariepinus TaxID=13013 RepID=UPI00234CD37C|nr:HMG domain-containing protein 4a isoform X1 [Clarias gariepinus]XP_053370761.1 HMG domain-containing protein 4a isoform X1 [Clarias gariepinus]
MEFEEIKRKGVMEMSGVEGEVGLVAGRSQREKRRSYKDLLREEEEIAAQVCKTSKRSSEDSELIVMGGDLHKKKKKHSSDEHHNRDHHGSGPPHKKKRKSSERSPLRSSSGSSQAVSTTDTAMGLLQAITSPMATGSEPGPNIHKKPSYPSHSSHSSSKDRKREGSSKSSQSFSHSFPHSRHPSSSSLSKKHSSSSSSSTKSSLFHSGAGRGEPLTLRDGEGLKMKLILSPKEKNESGESSERFPFPAHPSLGSMGHHSSSGIKKSGIKKEKDRDRTTTSKPPKKKQHSREALPVVGKEVEVEGQFGGSLTQGGEVSSSGGELEAGELIIDDSYTHLSSKKKKKSKKSKKKKDKEKDRDRDKSSKEKKHNKGGSVEKKGFKGDSSRSHSHSHSSSNHSTSLGTYAMAPAINSHHPHHQGADLIMVKKKKKEEKERDKHDKDKKKKKSTTAYQVFCKEYRANINAEQPGLVFGELSKKLAEVWKHLPEKEKQVWKQKAQYLQHKQIKAEATTVKQKTSSSENKIKSSSKVGGMGSGLTTPSRSSLTIRVPEVDPIDAAAHLQLLGESLSLIGHRLQETEGMVAVSGSLSVLLDSILCALGPLTCLTAQVPQLNGCPRSVLSNTLDNIAYIMPGL